MLEIEREICQEALDKQGEELRVDKLIEEMSELTNALLKKRQGRDHNVSEEMVDVMITLAVTMLTEDEEELNEWMVIKLAKLKKFLRGESNG